MNPIQLEARRRYDAAVEKRNALEIAQCEAVIEGRDARTLQVEIGMARITEAVARVQAVQLGVAS